MKKSTGRTTNVSSSKFFRALLLAFGAATFGSGPLPTGYASEAPGDVPAYRHPGESFEEAMNRTLGEDPDAEYGALLRPDGPTALEAGQPLDGLNDRLIPRLNSIEAVTDAFRAIRDDRFLALPEAPGFSRRIAWLFPDDGCYARAALAAEHIENGGVRRPAKIFLFGSLSLETPYHHSGRATWWYHVAPAFAVGDEVYILDPAVDFSRPLRMDEWIERLEGDESELKVATCNPFAYSIHSYCYISGPEAERFAENTHERFLRAELRRLRRLGREVASELGNAPPWLDHE